MAVTYVPAQNGGGGGGLGTLLTIGSMLMGMPTGMGMGAAQGMNGNPLSLVNILGQLFQGNGTGQAAGSNPASALAPALAPTLTQGNWTNPAQGGFGMNYDPGEEMINSLWGPGAQRALRGRGVGV